MTETNFPAPITYITELKPNSTNKKASGFWNDLNQQQYDALQTWKKKLLEEKIIEDFNVYDDLYLLRFLRARKFDLEKTTIMFKKFLNWRITEKVDDIREHFDFSEVLEVKKVYPHGYHKTDKKGRLIYIELISKLDVSGLFKITTEERMIKYYIKAYERQMKLMFPACSAVVKTPVEQSFTILDLNGIGISHVVGKTKSFVKLASDIGQDYYPEMLGTMFLLNTGFFFKAVWALVKGFIDPKTAGKIQMLGSSYQNELYKWADPENLPTLVGGTCTCSNIEGGCLYSDIGPWNPNGGIQVGDKNTNKGSGSTVEQVISA
jgi:hypothetical protein